MANVCDADPSKGITVLRLINKDGFVKYDGKNLCRKAGDWNVAVSLTFEKYRVGGFFNLVVDGTQNMARISAIAY